MDTELLARLLAALQEAVKGEVDLRTQGPVADILTAEGLRALMEEVAVKDGLAEVLLAVLREYPDMLPLRSCLNSILRKRTPSSTRRRSKKKCSRYKINVARQQRL